MINFVGWFVFLICLKVKYKKRSVFKVVNFQAFTKPIHRIGVLSNENLLFLNPLSSYVFLHSVVASSFSIFSIVGKFDFRSLGMALLNSYSAIPIG